MNSTLSSLCSSICRNTMMKFSSVGRISANWKWKETNKKKSVKFLRIPKCILAFDELMKGIFLSNSLIVEWMFRFFLKTFVWFERSLLVNKTRNGLSFSSFVSLYFFYYLKIMLFIWIKNIVYYATPCVRVVLF